MDYEFRQSDHTDATAEIQARLRRIGKLSWVPGLAHLALGAWIPGLAFLGATGALLYGLFSDVLPFPIYLAGWVALAVVAGRHLARVVGRTLAVEYVLADASPEAASATCPRCAAARVEMTGLCADCFGALVPSPDGSRLIATQLAAFHSGDARLERSTTNYPYEAHRVATASHYTVTRSGGATANRILRAGFPDLEMSSAGVFAERVDPTIIWTLMRSRGHSVRDGRPLDLNRMTRLRLQDGKVAETWEFPAMPRASGRAASPTAQLPRAA